MPKRSISTEIQSAALFAALDFVGKPQIDRDWLKNEFVDPQINAVRVTADIVDAVEEKLRERLTEFAKTLQEELAELLNDQDEADESGKATSAEFDVWFERCIRVIIQEESLKGNEVTVSEAHKILSKRLIV